MWRIVFKFKQYDRYDWISKIPRKSLVRRSFLNDYWLFPHAVSNLHFYPNKPLSVSDNLSNIEIFQNVFIGDYRSRLDKSRSRNKKKVFCYAEIGTFQAFPSPSQTLRTQRFWLSTFEGFTDLHGCWQISTYTTASEIKRTYLKRLSCVYRLLRCYSSSFSSLRAHSWSFFLSLPFIKDCWGFWWESLSNMHTNNTE